MNKQLAYNSKRIQYFFSRVIWLLVFVLVFFGSLGLALKYTDHKYSAYVHSLLISYWLLLALVGGYFWYSYRQSANHKFEIVRFNEDGTGLWLTIYGFKIRQCYIDLDWITVVPVAKGIKLRYAHALAFNQKGRPTVLNGDSLSLTTSFFDKGQLIQFVKNLNPDNQTAILKHFDSVPGQPVRAAKYPVGRIALFGAVCLIGLVGAWQFKPNLIQAEPKSTTAHKQASIETPADDSYFQKVNYRAGQTIETKLMSLTVNRIYQATSSDNEPLVIANVSVSTDSKPEALISIEGQSFRIFKKWSKKAESKRDDHSLTNMEELPKGIAVQVGGVNQPIMDVMDEGFAIFEEESLNQPFNLVFKRPKTKTMDLVYEGFRYREKEDEPGELDDTSVIIHINTQDLEVLTNG